MNRGTIEKLLERRWVKLFPTTDTEVCLVPYGMPESAGGRYFVQNTDSSDKQFCEDAFVDFRNWNNDDGTPVPNTLDERLFFFRAPNVRRKITHLLEEMNLEIIKGEDSGGSD